MKTMMYSTILAGALTLGGCQKDLTAAGGGMDAGLLDASNGDSGIPTMSGSFTHTVGNDGVITTLADATSNTAWHLLDLETGLEVDGDPGASTQWDLGFQRFKIISNGGVSGPGGVFVMRVTGVDFDALIATPEDGEWIADSPDNAEDRDDTQDSAFTNGTDDWYAYEGATHILTPRTDVLYVVRTHDNHFFKVQVIGYYDAVGTPGFMKFKWAQIAAPVSALPDAGAWDGGPGHDAGTGSDAAVVEVPEGALEIDASSRDAWTYFRISSRAVVSITDPETEGGWDVAFQRTLVRTNGGSSGGGFAAARIGSEAAATETDYDAFASTGTLGFVADELVESSTPGAEPTSMSPVISDWYDYDFSTHTVTPKPRVFVVRGNEAGVYAKLRVWQWVDGVFRVSIDAIEAEPETVSVEVNASSSTDWAYVDLHDAENVTVDDAATNTTWDLRIRRTSLGTNGGVSGAAMGGALELESTDFAGATTLPTDGYVVDTDLPSAMPGGPTSPGNAVLSAWYDYNMETHAVTPRESVFAVRLADGSYGKLRVVSYASGMYTLDWAYAGPGMTSF